jgi:hypothetical protein
VYRVENKGLNKKGEMAAVHKSRIHEVSMGLPTYRKKAKTRTAPSFKFISNVERTIEA